MAGATRKRERFAERAQCATGGVVYRYCAEHMGGLAQSVRGNAGLDANGRPGLMQRTVEPEAGFVLEDDDAAAFGGFFLIAGSRTSTHCC